MNDEELITLLQDAINHMERINRNISVTLPHCSPPGKEIGLLSIRLNNAQIESFRQELAKLLPF